MPIRVPRVVAPQEPQATRAGSPVPTPDPIGNPVGAGAQAAQSVGQVITAEAKKARDDEIELAISEADSQKAELDGAALNEFANLQGKEAKDRHPEFVARIRANSADVRGKIQDREVLQGLARLDVYRSQRSLQQLDAHYRREDLSHRSQQHQSRRDLLMRDWLLAVGKDAAEADRLRAGYQDEIRKLGALAGADAATVALALAEADARAVSDAIDARLGAGDLAGAKQVFDSHGEALGAEARGKFQGLVKKAERGEQAYRNADEIQKAGGTFADQYRTAHERWQAGKDDFETFYETQKELRFRDQEAKQRRAAEGEEALLEAQKWSQLNGGRNPDVTTLQRLSDLGVADDYDLWRLQGGQWITTARGYEILDTTTPADLLRHKKFDTLRRKHRFDLSERHMGELQTQWQRAWEAAGQAPRGSGSGTAGAVNIGTGKTVAGFWRQRSDLFLSGDIETDEKRRMDAFETEVDRRLAATGRKASAVDQADLDEVVRAVWNQGGVVAGRWLPFASMNQDERRAAQSVIVPADAPPAKSVAGWVQNVLDRARGRRGAGAVRQVTPEDFDIGGEFAEYRVDGQPDWKRLIAERDTDPASFGDRMMVLGIGQWGVGGTRTVDPATGEILDQRRGTVQSYDEAWQELAAAGVTPTPEAVQLHRAAQVIAIERANATVQAAKPALLDARRERFLEGLRDDYEDELTHQTERAWELDARARRRVHELEQQYPGSTVETEFVATTGRPDSWFTTSFTVRTPDGRRFDVVNNAPPMPTMEELETRAWAALRMRHEKSLRAYGRGIWQSDGRRDTDPLWLYVHGKEPAWRPSVGAPLPEQPGPLFGAQQAEIDHDPRIIR